MSSLNTENNWANWLERTYGSRRGMLCSIWHRLMAWMGKYDEYRRVDWGCVERLVFVCKGNICRSAYAEAVARSLGIDSVSCGLDTIVDAPANEDAIDMARKSGLDLTRHRTTPFMYSTYRKTDLLVAMEPWQIRFLNRHLTRQHQYTLLGMWWRPELPYIQDPYGCSLEYFDRCFTHIQRSVREIEKKIRQAQRN